MVFFARMCGARLALRVSLSVFIVGAAQLPAPVEASSSVQSTSESAKLDLWLVDGSHLVQIPLDDDIPQPTFVTETQSPSAVAVDKSGGLVWIYQKRHLLGMDERGGTVLDVDLSKDTSAQSHVVLAADDQHQYVWVGIDGTLRRFDFSGKLQQQLRLKQNIAALAVDNETGRIWIAAGDVLATDNADGSLREETLTRPISDIAFDPFNRELWVDEGDAVQRFDRNGEASLQVPVGDPGSKYLAPDGSGGVWVAGTSVVEHLDAKGLVLDRQRPEVFDGRALGASADAIVGIVADPQSGSVWIVGHRQILRAKAGGVAQPWFHAKQWPELHSIGLVAMMRPSLGASEDAGPAIASSAAAGTPFKGDTSNGLPVAQSVTARKLGKPADGAAAATSTCDSSTAMCGSDDSSLHEPRALWVSAHVDLYKVTPADGTAAALAASGKHSVIAVDHVHDVVWSYLGQSLSAFDASGHPLVATQVPGHLEGGDHASLLADGTSGTVWLAAGRQLLRFDQQGHWQATYPLDGNAQALALDTSRDWLWVADDRGIAAFDKEGQQKSSQPIDGGVTALAYDVKLGQMWMVAKHRLARFADSGIILDVPVEGDIQDTIAADGAGSLWAVVDKGLVRYDSAGALQSEGSPLSQSASGSEKILDLAADPLDHSVWVAGQRRLAQVGADGKVIQLLDSEAWAPLEDKGSDSHGHSQHAQGNGNDIEQIALYVDTIAPVVTLSAPVAGSYTNNNRVALAIAYSDVGSGVNPATIAATSDGNALPVTCQSSSNGAECVPDTPLADGSHTLAVTVADYAGNLTAPSAAQVVIDTVPPAITVTKPSALLTNQPDITVSGVLSEIAALTINDKPVAVDSALQFDFPVRLEEGANSFVLKAVDRATNSVALSLSITLDTVPPSQPILGQVSVKGPIDGRVTIAGKAGSVEGGATVTLTDTVTGATVSVVATADGSFVATLVAGAADPISVSVSDGAGNVTQAPSTIQAGSLPPDPSTLAPQLATTATTPFADQIGFLYEGAHPIQIGVAPGAIHPLRAAVVRGKVLDRTGQPMAGVVVSIHGHPELGYTKSRSDGMFDLVANGGGTFIVDYAESGYLPVQRTVRPAWRMFTFAPDVVLIPSDTRVTAVSFGTSSPQLAQGSTQEDADGERQASVFFPSGVSATMVMPDGSTQPLAAGHVRATEFTVGANGQQAMPGPLPPTSAYTYAVDFSIDEANAVGAKSVSFDNALPVYVDNFLDMPVGIHVPSGWYDATKGEWVASADGRVIKILGPDGAGVAQVDVDGSGQPAGASALGALGITAEERQQLGSRYPVGKTLWRVPVRHFTSYDFNWWGATKTTENGGSPQPPPDTNDNCNKPGCIIGAQSQKLGEVVPLAGTSMSLVYESDRVSGSARNRTLVVPLSGGASKLPDGLKHIDLTIVVAGQRTVKQFPPDANQSYTFTWDGKDAYGRDVAGSATAEVSVGYATDIRYVPIHYNGNSFGLALADGSQIVARRTSQEMVTTRTYGVRLGGTRGMAANDLGMWSLSARHAYDPESGTLYRGDGQTVETADVGHTLRWLAGSEHSSGLLPLGRAVFDSNGGYYVSDLGHDRIRHVDANGKVTTVTKTSITAHDVALGPDGTLFAVDPYQGVVWRIDTNGNASRYVGGLSSPYGLAVGPDGTLYVSESDANRIRRVGPDRTISTYAGTGSRGFSGDGGPATKARIARPVRMAVGADGSVYFGDSGNCRIRKIGPDGIISTVAGGGAPSGGNGDGGPATAARIGCNGGFALAPDGGLYITDTTAVRYVTPSGIISTIAGCKSRCAPGGPALKAALGGVMDMSVAPDGAPILTLGYGFSSSPGLLRYDAATAEVGSSDYLIPSRDGREVYDFDTAGRHLRTLDAQDGGAIFTFGYDPAGRLISITDRLGRVAHVQRDADGRPTAFVSPDGQVTVLEVNSRGELTESRDPMGHSWAMAYGAGGSLTSFSNPNGVQDHYTYDEMGRLASNRRPDGGGWDILRSDKTLTSYEVAMTSGDGLTSRFDVSALPNGDRQQMNIGADGTIAATLFAADSSVTTMAPDGTVSVEQKGADPRLGLLASMPTSRTIETPSGLTWSSTTSRTAPLAKSGDIFSFTQLTQTTTVNGKNTKQVFDPSSHLWTTKTPEGRTATVKVDGLDRPSAVTVSGIAPVQYSYDAQGHLASAMQTDGTTTRATSYHYFASGPAKGWLQSVTDPLGRTVSYEYDAAGRETAQVFPDGRQISYGYDANGNLTSLTPPSRPLHGFSYTALDQKASYVPPYVPGTGITSTQYQYNKDRQLTQILRPDGTTTTFAYDTGGRLGAINTPTGAYQYDYAPQTGQLAAITAPGNQVLQYTWDGFLPTGTRWLGTVNGAVTRTYDVNFRAVGIAVNGGNIAYGYDADGLLTSAGDMTVTRDASNGRITDTALGGLQTARTYNAFGEVASLSGNYLGGALFADTFQRDSAGRITHRTETVEGLTRTYDYSYDTQGRLADVKEDGQDLGVYGYDANGNRISIGGQVVGTVDEQDRLLNWGGNTYTYTANGDLASETTAAGTTQYSYDVFGGLREVKQPGGTDIRYTIDGEGRRIGKTVNGTLVQGFLYQDALKPVAELDGQGNVVSRFVYGTYINVPDYIIKAGKTYRVITDHLGSPRLVVDTSTGQVVQAMDYDVWGKVTEDTNPGFQPFGFAGGLYDRDTGLVRFGARDYDPETGRWTAKDPIGFAGEDSNLYTYAAGSPLDYIDPDGRDPLLAVVGALIGGVAGLTEGIIAGDSGWSALASDAGAGALTGGVVGLTDGASLIPGIIGRAAAGSAIEAGRQELVDGCVHDGVAIGLAGLGSIFGDAAGSAALDSGALGKAGAGAFGDVLGGAVPLPAAPSAPDR